jgi:hypothetical protein
MSMPAFAPSPTINPSWRYTEDWSRPEFDPGDLQLAADRRSALAVDRAERRIAVLFALGARITIRIVAPGDLAGLRARGGDLVLDVADLGASRIVLRLDDAEAADAWAMRLERLLTEDSETKGGRSSAAVWFGHHLGGDPRRVARARRRSRRCLNSIRCRPFVIRNDVALALT